VLIRNIIVTFQEHVQLSGWTENAEILLIWGHGVNTASEWPYWNASEDSRQQQYEGSAGHLQDVQIGAEGEVEMKGKGKQTTYWLLGEDRDLDSTPDPKDLAKETNI
ncbi:hypothetical protein CEXT_463171, partial [Caerostris extrusa]